MRLLLAAAAVTVALAGPSLAAPNLGDKPPRWEYAELTYRSTSARGPGFGNDPAETPPAPTVTVRWVNGAGEVEVKSWAELAEKLKATGFKKDGSASFQKIQVLNFLGGEGWELVEQTGPAATSTARSPAGAVGPSGTWMFKRRLP
jgi:hypothetical protein